MPINNISTQMTERQRPKNKKQERKQNYKDGSQRSVGHRGKRVTPLLPVM